MTLEIQVHVLSCIIMYQGRIQDFKLGGAHLKKLRRAKGGAKIFWVFRVKNHEFTPKIQIFSNCGGRRENCWVFRVKNHDLTPKNLIFSNCRGGGGCAGSPPESAPVYISDMYSYVKTI